MGHACTPCRGDPGTPPRAPSPFPQPQVWGQCPMAPPCPSGTLYRYPRKALLYPGPWVPALARRCHLIACVHPLARRKLLQGPGHLPGDRRRAQPSAQRDRPEGPLGAQTHPHGAGAAARHPGDTHWDTSAMCLWRRDTQRSSSSSRRTSLTRASPMPLVSYLGRGQERGGDGARGHTWLGGGHGAGGGCSGLCQRRGEVISV